MLSALRLFIHQLHNHLTLQTQRIGTLQSGYKRIRLQKGRYLKLHSLPCQCSPTASETGCQHLFSGTYCDSR